MNPFFTQIVIKSTQRKRRVVYPPENRYRQAKELRYSLITFKQHSIDALIITLGIFSAAFGFKGFLLTNSFIDGGATGISLLLSALTHLELYILIPLVNLPFILLGYSILGKQFAIKAGLAITGLVLVLALVPFPNVTNDNLLVAIFGGFFLGAGIGLTVRGGAVIDGTEILAIYLSKKLGSTLGDIVLIINVLIFSAAAYFLSIEIAMYSMITYLAASKTLDFIVEGIDEYIGVTIVSTHSEDIRQMIINTLGRGVTIYNGKRGFGKRGDTKDIDIIYTVITRLELNRLKVEIEKIEPNAFIVMNSIKDIKGGVVKKRPLRD